MTDEPTQSEKLAALHNDRLLKRATYSHVVELYDDTRPHGRFAVGASQPLTQYPTQPPHSPWFDARFNGPDPLGYSVDAMEPVGSPAEIEASIRRLEAAASTPTPSPCAVSAKPVEAAASPPPTIRRRC
jgi:hypothetical protein